MQRYNAPPAYTERYSRVFVYAATKTKYGEPRSEKRSGSAALSYGRNNISR